MALIEIDGLPNLKMVDLSMAMLKVVSSNGRVSQVWGKPMVKWRIGDRSHILSGDRFS